MFPHGSPGIGRGIAGLVCSLDGRMIATAGAADGKIKLWEAATGHLRQTLSLAGTGITSVAIAMDGSTLAAGGKRGGDGVVASWQLYASACRLEIRVGTTLWQELCGDGATAYRAILTLASRPRDAVALLKQRLRPVMLTAAVRKECDELIAALDDERFDVREQARRKLEAMSPWLESHFKKAIAGAATLELQRRLQALVDNVGHSTLPLLRAVEALEHAPGPEARELLRQIAAGEPQARITQEAQRSLQRRERLHPAR